MKKHITLLALSLAAIAAPLLPTASADTLLNTYQPVQQNGSYLYFSAASGVPFLSAAYYPGGGTDNAPALRRPDGSRTPGAIAAADVANAWIGFGNGYLTDGNPATVVSGWGGFTAWQTGGTNRGPYILFDLGAEYDLTRIDILLQTATAQNWNGAADVQHVWTAASLSGTPGTGTALSSADSYWTQKDSFTFTTSGTYSIDLSGSANARYVLLQLSAGTVDSRNSGGLISDVNFYANIPESSTVTLLLAAGALATCIAYKRLRK